VPAAVVAGLVAAHLAATSPVRVDGRPVTLSGRQICPRLVEGLPDRLGRLPARRVESAVRSAAAWGDPPVVLRCGVAPRIGPVGQVVTLDGVDWTADEDHAGVTWTTVSRRVDVQVRVPGRYDSQGPLLAMLSPILGRTVPKA
jgi:hypothetical protein